MKQPFDYLNNYFDKIYVITIARAGARQERLKKYLEGLNYQLFYGVDKNELSFEQLIAENVYDELLAKKHDRYNKPMPLGHIACSLSHKKVYEDVVANGYQKVLICEDDVLPDFDTIHLIPAIINELPDDWELLYLGYEKNETSNLFTSIKKQFYHLLHFFGLLKWNHTMISNLYPKKISTHISKAGFHDMSHAFAISYTGAEKLINVHSPVTFNADDALSFAVMNGWLTAYTTSPKIFYQEGQINPKNNHSLIHQ